MNISELVKEQLATQPPICASFITSAAAYAGAFAAKELLLGSPAAFMHLSTEEATLLGAIAALQECGAMDISAELHSTLTESLKKDGLTPRDEVLNGAVKTVLVSLARFSPFKLGAPRT